MLKVSSTLQETLTTDVLTMLQDDSIQPTECSSSQIDMFNDLDLAVLG